MSRLTEAYHKALEQIAAMRGGSVTEEDKLEAAQEAAEESGEEISAEEALEEAEREEGAAAGGENPEVEVPEEVPKVPEEEIAGDETGEVGTAEEIPSEEELPADEETGTAEAASDTPAEIPAEGEGAAESAEAEGAGEETQAMKEEIEKLEEENEDLKKAQAESGELAAAKVAQLAEAGEEGEGKGAAYPTMDFTALMYGSEDDVKKAQNDFSRAIVEYLEGQTRPMIEKADEAKRYADRESAARMLAQMEEMQGFSDMRGDLDNMISQNAILCRAENPMEQYILAYLARVGAETIANRGKEQSLDELMGLYHSNTNFRDAIEQERLAGLKEAKKTPPNPMTSGAGTAEPYAVEAPKTLEEAREAIRKRFKR